MKKIFTTYRFYLIFTIVYAVLFVQELISSFYDDYNFELATSFLLISLLSFQFYVYKKEKENE